MADQNLLAYIKQNLKDGFSENEIRKALLGAGWTASDVDESFRDAKSQPQKPGQTMDILEKELTADQPKKSGLFSNLGKKLTTIAAVVIALPVLGFGGFWIYQRFTSPTLKEVVNSATITSEQWDSEAAIRDRQRLENVETLQTALTAFYSLKTFYPQTLEELKNEKLLDLVPRDPSSGEPYLYISLGEPPVDYSLSFVLETDFGTLSSGLHNVSPAKLIRAADMKTRDQIIKGIIVKSASPDLTITDLADSNFSPEDEVAVTVTAAASLDEAVLLMDYLRLSDDLEPFTFTFTAPRDPGEYDVRVFGFAKNGSIFYQTTKLVVKTEGGETN